MTIDAFVYFAIVPSLLICLIEFVRVFRLRKHDVVLYRFCQIRRDMMGLLRERGTELGHQDYRALRVFLRTLNVLIQGYSDHRSTMLNFRAFAHWARQNAKLIKSTTEIPSSSNCDIQALQARTTLAIALGFFAYTRFLRSQVLLALMSYGASLFAQIGTHAIKKTATKVIQTLDQVEIINEHRTMKHSPECPV